MNKSSHSVYDLTYHLIFVTKYRKKIITDEMIEVIRNRTYELMKGYKGELLELNGESDHIHFLISLNPQCCLSDIINSLKTQLSRTLRKEFKEELSRIYFKDVFWSNSYFISTTGGANLEKIKEYIEGQGKPKRKYIKSGKYKKDNSFRN